MVQEYTHLDLGQEVRSISGYYVPLKELRMKCNGKEVLLVVGNATVDASCCGLANNAYAIVPGYVVKWKSKTNKDGLLVSEVEPVADETIRRDLTKSIKDTENVGLIDFW